MDRRGLLATLGASSSALCGCLGSSGPSSTETQSTTEPSGAGTETPAFDPSGTKETIRVGKNPGEIIPHGVVIWNALGSTTQVSIRIFNSSAGETHHEKTYDLPTDHAIAITLREPSHYQITLRIPEVDIQRTVSVPERLFDTCNESYTHVSIRKTDLAVRTMTTELECITTTENQTSEEEPAAID